MPPEFNNPCIISGGMITLKRNEDYYGKVPNIETVVYRTVSDETTKATMLQSGEADLAWLNSNYVTILQFKTTFVILYLN